MATNRTSGKSRGKGVPETASKPARMKSEICSGGRVVVKPGQTRYETQQEALNKSTKPATTDSSPATTEEVNHVSES